MQRSKLLIVSVAMLMVLSACGSRQKLVAVEGTAPAPKAYGAPAVATPAELLEANSQARPERNVELRRKSEARADDPFDLPPE